MPGGQSEMLWDWENHSSGELLFVGFHRCIDRIHQWIKLPADIGDFDEGKCESVVFSILF
jgi:hypothetical protein